MIKKKTILLIIVALIIGFLIGAFGMSNWYYQNGENMYSQGYSEGLEKGGQIAMGSCLDYYCGENDKLCNSNQLDEAGKNCDQICFSGSIYN